LQNNWLPTVLQVVESVITADTFYFTEVPHLKVVTTAHRLVFETAIPRVKVKIIAKPHPKYCKIASLQTITPTAPDGTIKFHFCRLPIDVTSCLI